MTEKMTKTEADKAWATFPLHGDGDDWAEPVAAEFWRARAREARLEKALRHVLSTSGVRLDALDVVRKALEE